jgi:protoporphyrinogen oxidase
MFERSITSRQPFARRSENKKTVAIVGAGPAGLTAGYLLSTRESQFEPVVFEVLDQVGGIARTANYEGYRFDIGGHRFFTKVPEVEAIWHEICGEDFLTWPRLSRIYYGKYYLYPLRLFNALRTMGPVEAARILLSYAKWQVRPNKPEQNFEQWVINRSVPRTACARVASGLGRKPRLATRLSVMMGGSK